MMARPFWFMLDRLVRHDMTPPSRAAYLFAVPADGEAELIELHETLNPAPGPRTASSRISRSACSATPPKPSRSRAWSSASICPCVGRVEELALCSRRGRRGAGNPGERAPHFMKRLAILFSAGMAPLVAVAFVFGHPVAWVQAAPDHVGHRRPAAPVDLAGRHAGAG